MATIGYLRLLFTSDTSGLKKGAKEVQGAISGVANSAYGMGKSLLGLGAVSNLVAGGSIAALGKAGADSIKQTGGMAAKLGDSAENVSRLGYAAKVSGVDSETLTDNLQKMQIRLGQVALTGEGKAAKSLRQFGLSAEELARGGATEAFKSIVGMLEQIPNPAERSAVAVDLLGKGAAGMMGFINKGTGAIAGLEAESDALGRTISDIDVTQVKEATMAVNRLYEIFGALGERIAVELSPYITAAAEEMFKFEKKGASAGDIVSQSMEWIVTAVGRVADAVQLGSTVWEAFKSAALFAVSKILEGVGWLGDKLNEFSKWMGGGELFGTAGIKEWAAASETASIEAYNAMEKVWSQPWAHEAIKRGAEAITGDAQSRAVATVEALKKTRGLGGELVKEAPEIKRAGAVEFGTKEAYSAILTARGLASGDKQSIIATAKNTERTATASEKTAQQLSVLTGLLGFGSSDETVDFLQTAGT
jgi:hypothetical protein